MVDIRKKLLINRELSVENQPFSDTVCTLGLLRHNLRVRVKPKHVIMIQSCEVYCFEITRDGRYSSYMDEVRKLKPPQSMRISKWTNQNISGQSEHKWTIRI